MGSSEHSGPLKLFLVVLGCRPEGRLTEQHDVFFGIAEDLKSLVPAMKASWPEAKGEIHIDSWREVTRVGDHKISVSLKETRQENQESYLFFINLGGYKPDDLEEYHYKVLTVARSSAEAIQQAKQTAFYRHTGLKSPGAASHVDDKYGIDTDDVFKVDDALDASFKTKYALKLEPADDQDPQDELHIGYVQIKKLLNS